MVPLRQEGIFILLNFWQKKIFVITAQLPKSLIDFAIVQMTLGFSSFFDSVVLLCFEVKCVNFVRFSGEFIEIDNYCKIC